MPAGPRGLTLEPDQSKEADEMPKVSKHSAAQVEDHGPVEDRHEDLDGYTVNFVTFRQDIDGTPLLRGLPDDRCQCHHWGYVLAGRVTYRFADREEVFEAGDAFYLPPGHVPLAEAGSEIVQFSPSDELRTVEAAMMRNMQAMQGA
jgi:mannose-6-phosphate isomerase-like protein (cupin superfamily)